HWPVLDVELRPARKERRGVPVRPDPQEDQVEPWDALAEHLVQLALVRFRIARVHRMNTRVHKIEQRGLGHPVIGFGMVGGHAPFVSEEHVDLFPRVRDARQPLVHWARRRPAGKRDRARTGLQEQLLPRLREIVDHPQLGWAQTDSSWASDTLATRRPRSRNAMRSPAACAAIRWPKE